MTVACRGADKSEGTADAVDSGEGPGGTVHFEDGEDSGEAPDPAVPVWRRSEEDSPGPLTFTELHYNPADDGETEWLELHNPMVLDLDVSGWRLTDGVDFVFPAGTVVPAGGFVVVAADPSAVAAESRVVGPWSGRLSNGGERLAVHSLSGRRIDSVSFADDTPWPVQPDGSGFTLSKVDLDAASDHAEHWTASELRGGTPGADNALDPLSLPTVLELVPADASWRFDDSGVLPGDDWMTPEHDDSDWQTGEAPFFTSDRDTPVDVTASVTADNYFAVYAGREDGADMRLVGEDSDGSWTTVESMSFALGPDEHLYLAAWELTGDSSSPQMVIGELEVGEDSVGTDASAWEWVLGAPGDNPQALPSNPPPDALDVAALVAEAQVTGSWSAPAAEAARGASPWGGRVGGEFTDVASFIWADTFSSSSITNTDDTFALFRTVDPALPGAGNTELQAVVTTWFRTDFTFSHDPVSASLWLDCDLDNGAVVYLNGEEVHREAMPDGAVDASTLALADGVPFGTALSTDALVRGDNVLAVEVHQGAIDDQDMVFSCSLTAETWTDQRLPTILLSELPGLEDDAPWVELVNVSDGVQSLAGLTLEGSTGAVLELDGELAPTGRAVVDVDTLALSVDDRLFLLDEAGEVLLDAVRVRPTPQARQGADGAWRVPLSATPGGENDVVLHEDIVINELMYHRAPVSEAGEAFAENPEEWLELLNRGESAVDLSGWSLVDGVSFVFPAGTMLSPGGHLVVARDADALSALHPDIAVVGDYGGALGDGGDRVVLLDGLGNPADEVRYFDGGRWPEAADGGGASLELMDPWADNGAAEAWAASDEGGRAGWVPVEVRGLVGSSSVGPDGAWDELVLGMLDAGTVLIDDLSVVRDPDGAREELLVDGSFDDGHAAWRLLGTHRHSTVVADPDDPANPVLRLVATGSTGHMHNHAETTLRSPVQPADEVAVSFRARWVSGSNQLHSRLYFNRLATTTLLPQPAVSGTPGAANSRAVDNIGPTFSELSQDKVVPAPGEPLAVEVSVEDAEGVAWVALWTAVDGAPFADVDMLEIGPGRYRAELEGLPSGTLVQFYVEAADNDGATATFPAKGADSRALFVVQDGAGSTTGLHDFRILMTEADTNWLHRDVNLMSNDRVGATVVYQESEVFYDVGVRLKGSERGRPTDQRVGYAVRFGDEHPFRGRHSSVMIDRSEGVGYGQREVLLNLAMTAAGSVSGEHNDLIQLIAPRSTYTGAAELQLDRFSNLVLDAQFDRGGEGTRYEYELVYYPLSTEDGADDGLKLPLPDSVVGTPITDLGDNKEDWRWTFLIKNNERRDDYATIQQLGRLFDLPTDEFVAEAHTVIDVDQWLRAFAMASIAGVTDQYGGVGSQHNAQFYVRPSDGRVLYLPHDLDFYSSATMAVVGNGDLARLLTDPVNARSFYGHLNDLIEHSHTTGWLQPWCDQLGVLLPAQDFDAHCSFMDTRAEWVRSGAADSVLARFPEQAFTITSPSAGSSTAPTVSLQGRAFVDVRSVELAGEGTLALEWLDGDVWQAEVMLSPGEQELVLVARDLWGTEVGRDTVTITVE